MSMYSANFHIKPNNVPTIDYKRPIPPRCDMRTSYHFGHRLIYDNDVHIEGNKVRGTDIVPKKRPYQPQVTSEMKASFTRKYPEPVNRYTSVSVEKVHGIKGFDETTFKFAPKPIHQHITTYKKDYTEKTPAPQQMVSLAGLESASKIKSATFTVSPERPGFSKYLDMMATSNMLDYTPFSEEQLSTLAARDNITFWTWNDIIKSDVVKEVHPAYISTFREGKDVVPSRIAAKNRSVPRLASYVPNGGLVSEFRSNYAHPDDSLRIEVDLQQPMHMVEPLRLTLPKSEYSMIGSGHRIQRYV